MKYFFEFDKQSTENKSCYARAEIGEPMFILLGRDPAMAEALRHWCSERSLAIVLGHKPNTPEEHAHVQAAMRLAEAADVFWHQKNMPDKQRLYQQDRSRRFASRPLTRVAENGVVNQYSSHDGPEWAAHQQALREAEALEQANMPGETPNDAMPEGAI